MQSCYKATGALLWASSKDMPYIKGILNRPGVKIIVQTILKHENPILINKYSESVSIEGITIIKTPGHTPGHVSFIYKSVLFCGDLFKIKNNNIKLPFKFMNYNQSELINSIKLLKELDFQWICPVHGNPVSSSEQIWTNFIDKY